MAAATEYPDWSSLPEDLLVLVMQPLEIPDLFSAGSVCSSWRSACSAVRRVRIPITDASPCLLYSCAADDPATATVYSPSSGVVFKVRLPDPPFRSRHVVGSAHGWVVAADEMSNLQALNPLTGAQVDLPPVTGLYHIESFSDEQGAPMYNHYYEQLNQRRPFAYRPQKLRLFLYHRVFLSCSPSAGSRCIVLLLHRPVGQLSFARIGDDRWMRIQDVKFPELNYAIRNATYNKNDGLFYVVHFDGSIFTLDLNGSSVVTRKVSPKATPWDDPTKYVILTPQGDILQLWRYTYDRSVAVSVVPPELAHEVVDPYGEIYTNEIELYKVDIDEQKLTMMKKNHFDNYAFFIGFNSSLLVSTKDYPMLKPNCAYFADDSYEDICVNKYNKRDIGIWNFETKNFDSIGDLQSGHPWLNFPSPIWITPSLC
ncbi:F-box protein SKIP23 [Brachypodium distachyon]|uniref:F-box domain-containing protein n=1 Tax=Brachypodium distachyon TaxID=15368 RepID=I1IKP5_BRADI|nr:F-box protein SKIP23 [Brachypodium distachyon]KQJ87996.1 hypothetical protein BRADI_4g14780v3 [Brachypodium distachyon]|eukprot:XP_003575911.1 F-box protein SKIP23 [Brachypodium distachyon]